MSDFYSKAREKFASAQINWVSATVKVVLTNSSYTPDVDNDEFLSDVAADTRIGTSDALTTKTATNGYLASDKISFFALQDTEQVVNCVFYIDTGTDSTASLIGYLTDAVGLPFVPQGKTYYLLYDLNFGGYFRL